MYRAFASLLLLLPACFCNDIAIASVVGNVVDRDGNPIVPDRVTLTARGRELECELDANRFSCWDSGGRLYLLRVTVGELVYEREVEVDYDGCHDETSHVDVVVD